MHVQNNEGKEREEAVKKVSYLPQKQLKKTSWYQIYKEQIRRRVCL